MPGRPGLPRTWTATAAVRPAEGPALGQRGQRLPALVLPGKESCPDPQSRALARALFKGSHSAVPPLPAPVPSLTSAFKASLSAPQIVTAL